MVKEMSLCVHFHEAAAASKQANDPSGYPAASGLWQADRIEINICRWACLRSWPSLTEHRWQAVVAAMLLGAMLGQLLLRGVMMPSCNAQQCRIKNTSSPCRGNSQRAITLLVRSLLLPMLLPPGSC